MALWEIQNQAKVYQDIKPDQSDVVNTWGDIDSAVKGMRPGNGLYNPLLDSYLLIFDYKMHKEVHWVKASETWFID